MRRWLAARKGAVATALSGTVITAVVAAGAILSNGYSAQQLDLDPGSVWVVNDAEQAVGRVNTQIRELDSVVRTTGTDVEVLQDDDTVLVVDRSNASLDVLDPATGELGETVALPPEQPEAWLAGGSVVIMARGTGEVWIVPVTDLQSFDPSAEAQLTFGKGAVATVDPDGVLWAYGPATGEVFRVDAGAGELKADSRWPVDLPRDDDSYGITAVAGRWAVLDADARRIALQDRGVVGLPAALGSAGSAVVQEPTAAAADSVLVAGSAGLVSVPFGDGSVRRIVTTGGGTPAAPVVLGDCRYAAWNAGAAWRQCTGSSARDLDLESVGGSAALSFVRDGKRLVLNDVRSGRSWAVQHDGELIDNWKDLLAKDDQQQVVDADEDTPPQVAEKQEPPVAVDDELGARPGRATVLPVLLNDYDPNGDVLVIDSADALPEQQGRLDLINRNQQLLLTLPGEASGVIVFRYTITDGHGGSASATVRVTVRQPGENSPPVQVRASKTTVRAGGEVTTQVLGDWIDPDGDAMYVRSASVAAPDRVSSKPDGAVLFSDLGQGGELKTVTLVVSDGAADGTGSLAITVRASGQVPIIADPFPVIAYAGQTITVSPLEHVRGGNGAVRLNAVPAKSGATVVPSFDSGTFTFVSDQVRTHNLEYVVTDGTQTVTGQVRVEVLQPPDANAKPITIPKTVFVHPLASETIDVAGGDKDPAGGVLLVTALTELPAGQLQAEVLEQRSVRVTLTTPLDGAVTFGYRITNGLAEATGTITVVQIPFPSVVQPPIARDDTATVRVGDIIDIPVLDNDEQPDGEEITLDPVLPRDVPSGSGLLFVSGDHLRFLAPKQAGTFTAAYQISSLGQTAQAEVKISVRERDAATNNPPVPRQVTARAIAGETVDIRIPLSGIDPDGDSVQLLGLATNPEKGSVTSTTATGIVYQAGAYSSGTDTFTYSVMDGLGARATGTIRVGIAARVEAGRNPVAVPDAVTVRPGATVTIPVLDNDSDPDGGQLTVTAVTPNDKTVTADVVDGRYVRVQVPRTEGSFGLVYSIENVTGGTASDFITLTVATDAPLSRPIADDTVLTVTDMLGKRTISVPVLDNVFFADGAVSSLGVELLPGYSSDARVLADKKIRVTVGDASQVIPFAVVHPKDSSVRAYAFLRVPGYDDALPQLNTRAPKITVRSESTVRIDLNDYVVALGGSEVRLADRSSVRATHANGGSLVLDDDTLQYTSADQYFGPASISFEVADGDPADPKTRSAVLTLPIEVEPRQNQPPVFTGASLEFEPGQQRELDLVRLTNYPYVKDLDELTYSVTGANPTGFRVVVNGQRLVITAADSAAKGTQSSVTLGVSDRENTGTAGRIQLKVVSSTRPLVRPVADQAIAQRGQSTTVDVLANDLANNPFPGSPLRVVDVRGLDSASLPAGVKVTPSADSSRLTVQVGASALPGDTTLQYQVADATGDPDRYVWGSVRISVQDRPDPVSGVRVTEFGDRSLRIAFSPGPANNSPITGYEVALTRGDGVISTTKCSGPAACKVTTPGNGPSNAVGVAVTAVNAIGRSDATSLAGTIWSDIIPPAPTGLGSTPLDQGLRVTWTKPDADAAGSPITYYVVTVGGVSRTVSVDAGDATGTGYSASVTGASIINGSSIGYTVSARNGAPNSLAVWNEANGTGTPAGPPIATVAPTASGQGTTQATIGWAGVFSANGRDIRRYYAVAYALGSTAPTCVVTGVDTGMPKVSVPPTGDQVVTTPDDTPVTSATFTGLTPDTTYRLVVFAYNRQGCTPSAAISFTPRVAPPRVTSVTAIAPDPNAVRADGLGDFTLGSSSISPAGAYDKVKYRFVTDGVDGSESAAVDPASGPALVTGNGSQYGKVVSIQVLGCKSYAELPGGLLCASSWSDTYQLGVPVKASIDGYAHDTPDGVLNFTTTWSWTSTSFSSAYEKVEISCDGGGTWLAVTDAGPGSCTGDSSLPFVNGWNPLTLRITSGGQTYERSYQW
ncbi:Ig-like domain-containing protein [Schumannella soli]|uniref:Tandem-95 repeat protein n=1 Tax=Schumannella soli TaxID=2590779 RepID=A0A506Y338_9MICO|nr:Ig-like domain-containing protein [Schumannella soli]TPW76000.1 tandem-95 repeat protein [Schumannella soli]